jgi:hypothetical protein
VLQDLSLRSGQRRFAFDRVKRFLHANLRRHHLIDPLKIPMLQALHSLERDAERPRWNPAKRVDPRERLCRLLLSHFPALLLLG